MKHLRRFYWMEMRRNAQWLTGGVVGMGLIYFLLRLSPKSYPGVHVTNFFWLTSLGFTIFAGISTVRIIGNDWRDGTTALTFTLPLPRWQVLLAKLLTVITYCAALIVLQFLSLMRLVQIFVPNPLVNHPPVPGPDGFIVQVTPGSLLEVLGAYFKLCLLTVLPVILAIIGLMLLASLLYQILPRFRLVTALAVFSLPVYGVIRFTLYLDQIIMGRMPLGLFLSQLSGDRGMPVLQGIFVTMVPFLLFALIGCASVLLGGVVLMRKVQR